MSDLRVTNLKGRTPGSSPTLPDGVVVTGVATATNVSASSSITAASFHGDGSQLEGIDATSLKDSNSTVRVQATTTGAVVTGVLTATTFSGNFSGDGSALTFAPKIIAYDPAALSTGISTTTNITFTFDQNIQFAGTGTIEVRETSNSGTIATSFTISGGTAPTGLSIVNNQLIINPTGPLSLNTVHYVVLPSAGIANTLGSYYAGSSDYNFRTVNQAALFSASGGNESFTVEDSNSPTGYYKYHIFSTPGPFTLGAPTASAESFTSMLIGGGGAGGGSPGSASGGGGGGAGGLVKDTGPTLNLASGSYTITVGAGAPYQNQNGEDSTINLDGNPVLTAYGGGKGAAPGGDGTPGGSGGGGSTPYFSGTIRSGGTGVSGQGYAGSNSGPHSAANIGVDFGAGGGGAGGTGSSGSSSGATTPYTIVAGNGGPGSSNPEFNATVLSPRVTSIPATSWGVIGPSGLYAGGGGGATGASPQQTSYSGGAGGSGGGGNGIRQGQGSQAGFTNTGGGGGAGGPGYGANGGSGVFMVRYASPN